MDKKEYDKGYNDAIEAIKKMIEQGGSNDSGGSSGDSNGLDLPEDPSQQSQSNNDSNNQQSQSKDHSQQSSNQSRGDGSKGVVRPEDCIGPDSLNKIPNTPGTFMDKSEGDKLAESEGYEKEGGSEAANEREWADAAIKAANKMKGDEYSNLKAKIEGLYKTSTDWKKALKNIIGHSLSPEDKRQAYANKNVLVSQDRISRTDKDKYDNVDYIMAWIDSSGSMSDEMLRTCLSEVYQIALKKKPLNIVIVQCDTRIQDIQEYRSVKELEKSLKVATVKGRGGTELKPCWDLLKNDKRFKRIRPELVMVFTDGYLNQYKRDPRTMRNLCWVILDNPGFNVQYKDSQTKCIYLDTRDIK